MIVVMARLCTDEHINHVLTYLQKHNLVGHISRGVEHTVIGVLGSTPTGQPSGIGEIYPTMAESIEGLSGVERVLRVSKPYKLASREFQPENTVVDVPAPSVATGHVKIGAGDIVMMAGPCTVENEKQLMTTAELVQFRS